MKAYKGHIETANTVSQLTEFWFCSCVCIICTCSENQIRNHGRENSAYPGALSAVCMSRSIGQLCFCQRRFFLLNYLYTMQSLLFLFPAGMQTVDGKADSKVEESDWIDITADVNAADESNQDTEEENLEGLDFQLEGINTSFQPNDDEGVEPLQGITCFKINY